MASFKRGRRKFYGRKSGKGIPEQTGEDALPFADGNLALAPSSFISVAFDCHRFDGPTKPQLLDDEAYVLPDLAALNDDEFFASCALAWSEAGLWFSVAVDQPVSNVLFPEITEGDSVELFIDTRDIKTSGFNTRFCHHFFFLPQEVDGHRAGELTRFRTEDAHEWCDAAQLLTTSHKSRTTYQLDAFIPEHCLHGYDPVQFDRLGFSYRINRCLGGAQHFSISSTDYSIEQQPSLWASVRLQP